MENRNVKHEDRNDLVYRHAAAVQRTRVDSCGDSSLSRDELSLVIEFFQLLDRWDRPEVVP